MPTMNTKIESDTLHQADVEAPPPALTPEEAHDAAVDDDLAHEATLVLLAALQALWDGAPPELRAKYTEPENRRPRR